MQSTTVEGMSMTDRQVQCGLTVSPVFSQFVEDELLPVLGLGPAEFWAGLESIPRHDRGDPEGSKVVGDVECSGHGWGIC